MIETMNGRGLCITCNNAVGCFYRASRGPALFCEMFDDYTPPVVRTPGGVTLPLSGGRTGLEAVEDETGGFAGLCMNCENRRTCGHARRTGGVWHCEDYA